MKAILFTAAVIALSLAPARAQTEQKAPMTAEPLTPPVAAKIPHSSTRHGITIVDDYHWMKDQGYPKVDDQAVLDHLKAENAYFEAQMKPRAAKVEAIFEEMKARLKEDESSVPQKDGNYLYWRKFEKGAQYKQWMRKPASGGADQLLLDEAKEAAGKEYFRLGGLTVSPDEKIMAFCNRYRRFRTLHHPVS